MEFSTRWGARFELCRLSAKMSLTDPSIRFCRLPDGTRLAYSEHGTGPLLVCPSWWVSHLERDWERPAFRKFFSRLARNRTVVRYDRPGVGLSDRARSEFRQETEVEVLDCVVSALGEREVDLLAISCAGPVALTWAVANPERVRRLVLIGAYAHGAKLGDQTVRDALIGLVEANWGMGAGMLNGLFSPELSGQDARVYRRHQLASASGSTAAQLLGLSFALDARGAAEQLNCPALVIHRKKDHTVRFEAGRDLAASLPNATFVPLPGGAHIPWLGDPEAILDQIDRFLAGPEAAPVVQLAPSWERRGEVWSIQFEGHSILLKHSKGLADLRMLLQSPGDSIEALRLALGTSPPPQRPEPVIDRSALRAYQSRLNELTLEVELARAQGAEGDLDRLLSEREALLDHVAQASGLGGRIRQSNSEAERARKAVSARIRDAIDKVAQQHDKLGAHLQSSVSTGAVCVYKPQRTMAWRT